MLQYIYQQPNPVEKFLYDSLVRKKTSLKAEFIFCHHTLLHKIWVVADLYSQLEPPLLSAHTLRKTASRNEGFIADIMQQKDVNISFYKFSLHDSHIRRTSRARQRNAIEEKLRELKKWQRLGYNLNTSDREWIDNTIALEYSETKDEKKVYLGFTTYFYNAVTNCKEKLGETIFSNAIYDSCDFLTVNPCISSTAGGSTHILKTNNNWKISQTKNVRLLLTDVEESWHAATIGEIKNDGIYFVAPPYTGNWNSHDGNRLIDIKVLSSEGSYKKYVFKFVYV